MVSSSRVKKGEIIMSTVKNVTEAKKPTVSAKAASIEKKVEKKAEAVKKEVKKEVKAVKPAVKKAVAKTTEKAATVKKAAKISIQFADKDYSMEALEKIAKDVWVYDYEKKATDLKTVELYVKPEESKVYYVFNGDVSGAFEI